MKARVATVLLAGTLALAGCGTAKPPTAAEEVPALRTALAQVYSDLEHHHVLSARPVLARIIADATAAERDGTLSRAAAKRIINAARRLLALLPKPSAPASSTPTPTPQVTAPSPTPTRDHPTPTPTKAATTAPVKPTSSPRPTPTPTPSPSATTSPSSTPTPSPAVVEPQP